MHGQAPICTMHSKPQQGTAAREEGVRGKWAPFALQTVWTGCVGTARLLAVLATMLLLSLLPQKRTNKKKEKGKKRGRESTAPC